MKQTKIQEIRLLINDEEVLDEANDILAEKRYSYYMGGDGHLRLKSSLVWTELGRELIRELVYGN